jgi:CubicO group peptidase (beta-lactamase class C family)
VSGAYFPPDTGDWEKADAQKTGWSPSGLDALTALVRDNRSSTFMMLAGGRILVEEYFNGSAASVQDVASVQKSVTSTLLGIAREKGLLGLDDKVPKYLGHGWSNARPPEEDAISLRHLMTHSSGLDPRTLRKAAEPGTVFDYNTEAYQKLRLVLEKAAGMDINALTRGWLFNQIGVSNSSAWRARQGAPDATGAVQWGIAMTARDMARFGLVALRRGQWSDRRVVASSWFDEAWASSPVNAGYGLLWWLLGKGRFRGQAPADWVAALGARDQKVYVVPSLDLVVTRQGLAAKEESEAVSNFDADLLKAIAAARA